MPSGDEKEAVSRTRGDGVSVERLYDVETGADKVTCPGCEANVELVNLLSAAFVFANLTTVAKLATMEHSVFHR